MNRLTIITFSFIAGALIADLTHPAGSRLWSVEAATDSEVGCMEDCLEPEEPAVLTCWPKKTYIRCEVLDNEAEIDWEEWLKGRKT